MGVGLAKAADIRREIAKMVRPPERISVSEASERHVKVRTPSGAVANWSPDLTPYIVEPMNHVISREHNAVVFVGPAQSGKTQGLITGSLAYIIKCDPSDAMILQTTKGTARDFDQQVIKRGFRDSPALKEELAAGSKSDNTYDKVFRAGNILFQRWPSINELSGKPIKYMLLTDYDRMTQDVDGEGTPFALSQKRTTKFLSRGMTVVDTSPGYMVSDPKWRPRASQEHAAPPCAGALSLFNMGDMRRWYVKCPDCGAYYMPPPDEKGLSFPHVRDMFGATLTEITREISFVCTASGCHIPLGYKREMNASGLWVPQDCRIENDEVVGERRKTKIASFWFPGILAAYSDPEEMVAKFLNGHREYDITGEEQNLKTCINVDFGAAFVSQKLVSTVSAEEYQGRAEALPEKEIPEGVRFIVANIDVQSWGFEVQVTGYGKMYERWIIDRYAIRLSNRKEKGDRQPCDPSAYLEDWDLIHEQVMVSSYLLSDGSDRRMAVAKTICDSGGKEGVTARAYDYWRKLRDSKKLKAKRLYKSFHLIKGERPKPEKDQATVRQSFPENTSKSKKKANARGEIPLYILNTTRLKDAVSNDLARTRVGPGYIHFPTWLKASFFEELVAEVRTDSGWDNPTNSRNETFDLIAYGDAGVKILMVESRIKRIDWDSPPSWAAEWDDNKYVFEAEELEETQQELYVAPKEEQVSIFDTQVIKSQEL